MIEALLIAVIVLLVVVIFLILQLRKPDTSLFENSIASAINSSGLLERVGELSAHIGEIKNLHRDLDRMLRVPTERGAFGEIALENILSEHLPPDMFGIRKRIANGKTPDAYIKSSAGIICIDSKFPVDNFRRYTSAESNQEKEEYKKKFLTDVKNHLEKIKRDYVGAGKDLADFAFAFIPSEGVYWFLVKEGYELLRDYAIQGVQVVSPLTIAHKIELIKAGVHARKISEEADRILEGIKRIRKEFESLEKEWNTFFNSHLKNAYRKADQIDGSFKRVLEEFKRVSTLTPPSHKAPEAGRS